MPTQEELNAAQVELDIANDNYAALADRYNRYQKLFQEYANSSPEIKERATEAMWWALEDYYQLQDKMRAAEDRIAVAQNTVNSYNEIMAQQQATAQQQTRQKRRTITRPTNDELRLQQYLNAWYYIWDDGLMYTPTGIKVNQNWFNLNSKWQFVEAPVIPEGVSETPIVNQDNTQPIIEEAETFIVPSNSTSWFQVREWWNPVYNNKWEIVWEQRVSTPSFQVREWWKPVYNNKWEIVWEQKVPAPTLNSMGSYPNSRFRNTISWTLPYWTNWALNWTLKYWGNRRTLNTSLSWYQAPTPTYTGWYRNLNTWWPGYKWTLN